MKHIYLNLKRFDVPVEFGGVNRLAPVKNWGRAVVSGTQEELKKYDPAEVEFVQFLPEAHLLNAVESFQREARCRSEVRACIGIIRRWEETLAHLPPTALLLS